tara:strand:- start:992 stop:1471 length:480 start_codon:yes stop_codon:yes gene_type:complete
MKEEILSEALKLGVQDRIVFVEDIWDSIANVPESVELQKHRKKSWINVWKNTIKILMPVPRGTKLRINYWQKMGYKVILRPKAELDLEDAYDWYENQLKGLGADLLAKVDDSLNIIKESPKIFPIIHKNIRRALIHRFPYGIFLLHRQRFDYCYCYISR